jgi:hypothetical protein
MELQEGHQMANPTTIQQDFGIRLSLLWSNRVMAWKNQGAEYVCQERGMTALGYSSNAKHFCEGKMSCLFANGCQPANSQPPLHLWNHLPTATSLSSFHPSRILAQDTKQQ